MIELKGVSFSYGGRLALDRVSLRIDKGEHVAIVGPNASGKTTLAMAMNALITPDEGDCIVDEVNTKDDRIHARKSVGMVFQDPESQAVARRVRDDVAFGPRNLGLPEDEVGRRIKDSLRRVGMSEYEEHEVSGLSGGQKQLLAIASILAMRPSYVVLDEPASLLDGRGSRLVREAIAIMKKGGAGIIDITHDMEDAFKADRIIALRGGQVLADMAPAEFFSDKALMGRIGVKPPFSFELLRYAGAIAPALEVVRECR